MSDRVTVTMSDDGVADVRLVRADKMNALDRAMFEALVDTGERLCTQPGLRAVVLSGEGRAFCAGLDMGRFQEMAGPKSAEEQRAANALRLGLRTHGDANAAQHAVLVWKKVPVPVIAAVHGVAFGGGLQLALGADIRLIAPDARMSVMEIKWGLVPDMAGVVLMRGLVRDDVVRELTYTGRVVQGEEAVRVGLATRVCADPLADAMALAAEMAQRSPDALKAGKRLFNRAAALESDAALLQAESDEQVRLMGSPNQVEAVRANLEKRAPRFAD